MKKKIDIDRFDFDMYINDTLKSYGFLFPENDEQMKIYEQTMESVTLPSELESPSFVFDMDKMNYVTPKISRPVQNIENERNWAIAARDGKDIPADIWEQMKRDKEASKNK